MRKLILISILLSCNYFLFSQQAFQKVYSIGMQNLLWGAQQTSDGGFIMTGFENTLPPWRVKLIKTDLDGNLQWAREYGKSLFMTTEDPFAMHMPYCVRQTSDGGYIVTGSLDSKTYLLKVTSAGAISWAKTYGGGDESCGYMVKQTTDGGYIVTGYSYSLDPKDSANVYLLKTNSSGALTWDKIFRLSPNDDDYGYSVDQVADGYVVAGYTSQTGGGDTTTNAFLLKTNLTGTLQWSKTWGVISNSEEAYDVKKTSAGGFVVTGTTTETAGGADGSDIFLIGTDGNGNLQWSSAYSYGIVDMGTRVAETASGFAVFGTTMSLFGLSFLDMFAFRTNTTGTPISGMIYNQPNAHNLLSDAQITSDGGSFLGGWGQGLTSTGFLIVKTAPSGYSGCYENSSTPNVKTYNPTYGDIAVTTYSTTSSTNIDALIFTPTVTIDVLCQVVPLVASAGPNVSICQGNSVVIGGSPTATGGTGPYSYSWSPSTGLSSTTAANPTASPSSTQTYTVTVTDNLGATATSSCTVTVNTNPTANAGSDVDICQGSGTQLNASGGTGYSWSPATGLSATNISNPVASPSTTTTYTVTVTNAAGCTATDQITVNVNSVTANAGPDQAVCTGQQVTLTATGGGTYQWNNGVGQGVPFTPVTTLTYTVTVTSDVLCTATDQVVVTVNPLPAADAGLNDTICGGSSTNLNATGGTTYLWSPPTGLSNVNISNPVASPQITTTYTVTVTDVNNCSATDQVTITVNAPVADAGNDATICPGNSTALNATGAGTYSWSPATGLSATNIANPTASPVITTTYTVTVTDGQGCFATDSVVVNVLPAPPASAGNDTSTCDGLSVQLIATGGITYTWSPAGTLSNSNISNPVASPVTTTTYTVTVTGANGCSATAQIQVTVNPLPTANAGNDVVICGGNSTTLSATGGVTYLWSPPTGLSSVNISNPDASPSLTTTYTVTVTDVNGCTDSDQITVTVNAPSADAGPDVSICQGSSTTLSGTGAGTYTWGPSTGLSATNIPNPVASPVSTTTYTLTVTDTNGCIGTDDVSVTVNPNPTAIASNDTAICLFQSVTISAQGGVSYSWSPVTGLSSSTVSNPVASPTSSITYTVTVTDINGCTDSESVLITVNNLPSADAGNDVSFCSGLSANLNATGGVSYQWSPSTGLSSTVVSNPVASPASTTTYTVTVTDGNGCQASDDVIVTVGQIPSPQINGSLLVCENHAYNYSVINDPGHTYSWTVTGGTPTSGTSYIIAVTWGNNVTGNIIVTETDAGTSCTSGDTITVVIRETPVAIATGDTTICSGINVTISATGSTGTPPLYYLWSNLGTTGSQNVAPAITTDYIVTVSNSDNCESYDTVSITVKQPPAANLSIVHATCDEYTDGSANLTITSAIEPVTYSWSTGSNSSGIGSLGAGTYYYTISDASGCSRLDTVDIISLNSEACLLIPTLFTPNGDKENDVFEIKNIDLFPGTKIEIYNRWGDLMHKSGDYSIPSNWWDGKWNGKDVSVGSYVFILTLPGKNPMQGIVSIVR